MIHISDPRLVRLVLIGKKTRHTFPAQYRKGSGELTQPKIIAGREHYVYDHAPFGSYGSPDTEPLGVVYIESVNPDVLSDLTDADVKLEGFASLSVFRTYWNDVWSKKGLDFDKNRLHPVWTIHFKLKTVLPAGVALLECFSATKKKKKRVKTEILKPKKSTSRKKTKRTQKKS